MRSGVSGTRSCAALTTTSSICSRRCSAALLLVAALAGCGADDTPEPPARIVALTRGGDLVLVDRAARARPTRIASFRERRDAETGLLYERADDVTSLSGNRFLVSICCEPAGGAIDVVEAADRRPALSGWDPQVDTRGDRVAVGSPVGIFVFDASLAPNPRHTLEGDPSAQPRDPSWSPDGHELVFTAEGRLGRVPVDADSLAEAELLEPQAGTYWSLPAYTSNGVVAVEQRGRPTGWYPSGPSRLLGVDLKTGDTVELASSRGPITDVSVDASGRYLLWVDREGLKWRVGETTSRLDGDFVAAAWVTASRS